MNNLLIILNYNTAEAVKKLVDQTVPFRSFRKIIIVDNCSADDSYRTLCGHYLNQEKIDVIRTPENGGYAAGNNFGISYAINQYHPEFIFIANPDVEFSEDTVKKITEVLSGYEKCALCTALTEEADNAWKLPGFGGVIRSMFLIIFNLEKQMLGRKIRSARESMTVGAVEGSFFGTKAEAFQRVGGFDERTFLYYEENLLGSRLKAAGYEIRILGNARYRHEHGVSIRKSYQNKARAFLNYKRGIELYLREYLKAGSGRLAVFQICFYMAYFERMLYSVVLRLKGGWR